jgi:hypothetical protein
VEILEKGVTLIPDNNILFSELSKARAKLNRITNASAFPALILLSSAHCPLFPSFLFLSLPSPLTLCFFSDVREMRKVWEIQEEENIESVDIAPNSHLAALGLVEGDIKVSVRALRVYAAYAHIHVRSLRRLTLSTYRLSTQQMGIW